MSILGVIGVIVGGIGVIVCAIAGLGLYKIQEGFNQIHRDDVHTRGHK